MLIDTIVIYIGNTYICYKEKYFCLRNNAVVFTIKRIKLFTELNAPKLMQTRNVNMSEYDKVRTGKLVLKGEKVRYVLPS